MLNTYTYRKAFYQDNFSTGKNKRSICRDSNGQIFIVYTDYTGTYDAVYLARSSNMGYSWTAEKVPGQYASVNNRRVSIAVDSNNSIIVVWAGRTVSAGETQILYRKRTSAGVWGSVVVVDDPIAGRLSQMPSVAIDSNDKAHICWLDSNDSPTYDDISYNTVDSSGTLGTEINVTNLVTSKQISSEIAVCKDDIAHIVWCGLDCGTNPTHYNIQYNTVDGGVLGAQVAITDRAVRERSPECAIDSGGFAHIIYGETTDLSAQGLYYTNNTSGSFATPTRLTTYGTGAKGQSITFDADDNIYVFYCHTDGLDIFANPGTGWSKLITISLEYSTCDVWSMWSWYPRSGSVSPNVPKKGWFVYLIWPKNDEPDFYAYLMFPSSRIGSPIIDQVAYQHCERMIGK